MANNVFASRYTARQVEEALERAMSAVQSINGQTPGTGGDVFVEALKLQKGDPASVDETRVSYAASSSGKDVPGGAWSETVPAVPQGEYLWTRVTVVFNSGEPVVFYSVSRMGMDGRGSVAAVNGISPTSDGNVILTAGQVGARPDTWLPTAQEVGARPDTWTPSAQEVGARPDTWTPSAQEVGALPVSGGSLTGALSVPEPSRPEHAASKAYVDGRYLTAYLTLTASGWSKAAPYTQTVAVEGVAADKPPHAAPVYSGDTAADIALKEACAAVSYAKAGDGTVCFTCLENKPAVDIPVRLEVRR